MEDSAVSLSKTTEKVPEALLDLESPKQGILRVLHVDDDASFLNVSKQILEMKGKFEVDDATSVDEALRKMKEQTFDAVVSDYEMPLKDGLKFLSELRATKDETPFILFTGRGREEVAIAALNLGADRYINKLGDPETVFCELAHAINMVVEGKKAKKMLTESEMKYRTLVESSLQGIAIAQGVPLPRIVFSNKTFGKILGYTTEEITSLSPQGVAQLIHEEDREVFFSRMKERLTGKQALSPLDFRAVKKDGSIVWLEVISNYIVFNGQPALLGTFLDITDRVEAQKKKKESEEKYKELANALPQIVFETDLTGKITFVNDQVSKIAGYAPEEVINHQVMQFIIPEQKEKAAENLKEMLLGNVIGSGELTFMRKDGSPFLALVKSAKIFSENKVVGLRGILLDITEQKKAQDDLQKSEERLRTIVANSPIGIATSYIDKHFLSANDAFCKILGYTEDELRKLTFKEITHPEDMEESAARMEDLETGRISSFTLEKRYIKKDGSVINGKIMVSATRDQKNRPTLFIAELEDISEQKKKERELKEERKKLETITQSIGAGFVVISKDFHVLWANKFIKEYKGDIEGKLCYATLNDLSDVCPDCGVKKVYENGIDIDAHEYASIDIKGKPYWVEIIATPIRDDAGNIISATEIAVDITEKKNLQQELAEYSQNLEKIVDERTEQLKQAQARLVKSERLAAIGELAAMVGHDLRNPLAGMGSATYYLNKKCSQKLTATELDILKTIDNCIDHSNKIVNDLLEYSREINLEKSETTPKELVTEALTNLKIPEAIQVIDLTENEPRINVDTIKMNRILVNIFKNAFDAMPNGGTLKITTKNKDGVEMKFTDTGVGMSEETLGKIWNPLFTTKASGMGFGLAICKRFVEAHGGIISATSTLGKGTTFTIKIPISSRR